MALAFPTIPQPNVGDKFTPPGLGKTWQWTGTVWKLLPREIKISDVTDLSTTLSGYQEKGDYATLVGGLVPSSQLPSFVDDVVEYDGSSSVIPATYADASPEKNRPTTGEKSKIYVDTNANNKTYRWSGTGYVEITATPGTTDAILEGTNNLYYLKSRVLADAPVLSVNGQTGAVTLTTADIGGLDTLVAGGSEVTSTFSVINVDQGSYKHGDTIAGGTALETVIKKMLQKQIDAVYTSPSLAISSTATKTVEYGTNVAATIEGSYTIGNAGALTGYRLKKNSNIVQTGASIADYTETFAVTADVVFRAEANYAAGPQLNDNFGQPSGTPIPEVTNYALLSNEITFSPARGVFYDTDQNTFRATDSEKVRALSSPYLNLVNGSTFTITIPNGTRRITIAYPASFGPIDHIKHVDNGNSDVTDTFHVNTNVSVLGANDSTGIAYRVYTWPLNFSTSIAWSGDKPNTFSVKL